MDLNDIIRNLLDWVHDSKIVIKKLSIYSECGGVYLDLDLRKKKNGKQLAISRIFYLGEVCCSENWDNYANNFQLNEMIKQLEIGEWRNEEESDSCP